MEVRHACEGRGRKLPGRDESAWVKNGFLMVRHDLVLIRRASIWVAMYTGRLSLCKSLDPACGRYCGNTWVAGSATFVVVEAFLFDPVGYTCVESKIQ